MSDPSTDAPLTNGLLKAMDSEQRTRTIAELPDDTRMYLTRLLTLATERETTRARGCLAKGETGRALQVLERIAEHAHLASELTSDVAERTATNAADTAS